MTRETAALTEGSARSRATAEKQVGPTVSLPPLLLIISEPPPAHRPLPEPSARYLRMCTPELLAEVRGFSAYLQSLETDARWTAIENGDANALQRLEAQLNVLRERFGIVDISRPPPEGRSPYLAGSIGDQIHQELFARSGRASFSITQNLEFRMRYLSERIRGLRAINTLRAGVDALEREAPNQTSAAFIRRVEAVRTSIEQLRTNEIDVSVLQQYGYGRLLDQMQQRINQMIINRASTDSDFRFIIGSLFEQAGLAGNSHAGIGEQATNRLRMMFFGPSDLTHGFVSIQDRINMTALPLQQKQALLELISSRIAPPTQTIETVSLNPEIVPVPYLPLHAQQAREPAGPYETALRQILQDMRSTLGAGFDDRFRAALPSITRADTPGALGVALLGMLDAAPAGGGSALRTRIARLVVSISLAAFQNIEGGLGEAEDPSERPVYFPSHQQAELRAAIFSDPSFILQMAADPSGLFHRQYLSRRTREREWDTYESTYQMLLTQSPAFRAFVAQRGYATGGEEGRERFIRSFVLGQMLESCYWQLLSDSPSFTTFIDTARRANPALTATQDGRIRLIQEFLNLQAMAPGSVFGPDVQDSCRMRRIAFAPLSSAAGPDYETVARLSLWIWRSHHPERNAERPWFRRALTDAERAEVSAARTQLQRFVLQQTEAGSWALVLSRTIADPAYRQQLRRQIARETTQPQRRAYLVPRSSITDPNEVRRVMQALRLVGEHIPRNVTSPDFAINIPGEMDRLLSQNTLSEAEIARAMQIARVDAPRVLGGNVLTGTAPAPAVQAVAQGSAAIPQPPSVIRTERQRNAYHTYEIILAGITDALHEAGLGSQQGIVSLADETYERLTYIRHNQRTITRERVSTILSQTHEELRTRLRITDLPAQIVDWLRVNRPEAAAALAAQLPAP